MLIAFHKPYGVLSQFTTDGSSHATLASFQFPEKVYPLGRLDADSEGLLLLSDEPGLNSELLDPSQGHRRRYLVQVEGIPTPEECRRLGAGVVISGYTTKPCIVRVPDPQPVISARVPPIRVRKSIPDSWIELSLVEGKNRQVRRMTAAIGHPTLRLIRTSIGDFELGNLAAGTWRELTPQERVMILGQAPSRPEKVSKR